MVGAEGDGSRERRATVGLVVGECSTFAIREKARV